MSYKLVVSEKPSVGAAYAKVLGATNRQDGYWEGNGYLVSWCIGHLVELAPPNVYDEKYVKWSVADLPILPAVSPAALGERPLGAGCGSCPENRGESVLPDPRRIHCPDGRKLKGEDFKKENAKIFAALPMVVQRWAGSPADLSEIFSSRSSADLRQFVRPGFDRAVQDAPVESLQPPALPGGAAPAQIGGGTA